MMILVQYLDGTYDMVMSHHLGTLITEHRIIGFERSNKWVTIGIDKTRGDDKGTFEGVERRQSQDNVAVGNPEG